MGKRSLGSGFRQMKLNLHVEYYDGKNFDLVATGRKQNRGRKALHRGPQQSLKTEQVLVSYKGGV